MVTAPSSSSLAARSNATLNLKNMVSSETVGTIGTIKTELGDLDDFAAFLSRSAGTATERRPTVRRKTTNQSQSSRFVEGLLIVLPFFKRIAMLTGGKSWEGEGGGRRWRAVGQGEEAQGR